MTINHEDLNLDALEIRALRFHKLNPIHECFDSTTVLALIDRLREAEEAIENTSHIHGPRKVWESDRAYTLVCTVCITEQYPCATVRTLSRYKPTNQEDTDA